MDANALEPLEWDEQEAATIPSKRPEGPADGQRSSRGWLIITNEWDTESVDDVAARDTVVSSGPPTLSTFTPPASETPPTTASPQTPAVRTRPREEQPATRVHDDEVLELSDLEILADSSPDHLAPATHGPDTVLSESTSQPKSRIRSQSEIRPKSRRDDDEHPLATTHASVAPSAAPAPSTAPIPLVRDAGDTSRAGDALGAGDAFGGRDVLGERETRQRMSSVNMEAFTEPLQVQIAQLRRWLMVSLLLATVATITAAVAVVYALGGPSEVLPAMPRMGAALTRANNPRVLPTQIRGRAAALDASRPADADAGAPLTVGSAPESAMSEEPTPPPPTDGRIAVTVTLEGTASVTLTQFGMQRMVHGPYPKTVRLEPGQYTLTAYRPGVRIFQQQLDLDLERPERLVAISFE